MYTMSCLIHNQPKQLSNTVTINDSIRDHLQHPLNICYYYLQIYHIVMYFSHSNYMLLLNWRLAPHPTLKSQNENVFERTRKF